MSTMGASSYDGCRLNWRKPGYSLTYLSTSGDTIGRNVYGFHIHRGSWNGIVFAGGSSEEKEFILGVIETPTLFFKCCSPYGLEVPKGWLLVSRYGTLFIVPPVVQ